MPKPTVKVFKTEASLTFQTRCFSNLKTRFQAPEDKELTDEVVPSGEAGGAGSYYCLADNGLAQTRYNFTVVAKKDYEEVQPTVRNAKLIPASAKGEAKVTWEDNPAGVKACGGGRMSEDPTERQFALRIKQ